MNEKSKKLIKVICLVVIILISFFGLSRIATSPKTYSRTLKALQEKENTVAIVTTSAAAAATALAAVPTDVTTPISNHILEISSYLILVTCVICLEKSAITLLGMVACCGLIPLALILLVIRELKREKDDRLKNISIKIIAFALVLLFIIPISVEVGNLVTDANKDAIEQIVSEMDSESESNIDKTDSKWNSLTNSIKKGTVNVINKAEELNMKFINTISIFIVSNCLIPIAVIAFLMWLIKILFGITIDVPKMKALPKFGQKKHSEMKDIESSSSLME